ncbi:hypothetical protein ACFL2X_04195 [Candidatus Latescibacterota bacterium]
MKKVITVIMLLIIAVCACENEVKKNKETGVRDESPKMEEKKKPVLMTGELDEFHPESEFESIRKTKLTNLGTLNSPPPVYTPDRDTAWDALNAPGFSPSNVEFINSNLPWRPKYPFDYENDLNALKRLYDSHNIGDIVKGNMSELDTIIALMVYTYNFMEGGTQPTPETDIGPSAEIITKLRRDKGIGGSSKHYSALFCQLALSCGFNARIIGMHTIDADGELITHNICEVFIDEYAKWIAFDVYSRCTYYERNKILQSALELHNIVLNNNYSALNTFSQFGDFSEIISVREKLLPVYRHIYMWRMNDILGKSPRGGSIPWQALYQAHLVWEDEKATIAEGRFDELEQYNNTDNPKYPLEGVKYVTHDKDQFYWRLNFVDIHLERVEEMAIKLYFDTLTPNFKEFIISANNDNLSQSSNIYYFKGFWGLNTFRSSNVFERESRFSHLNISP